jgi:hypothetical protein
VLNDGVWAWEYQRAVTVFESHEVRGFPASPADLDDLAHPVRLTHDAAMNVKPVPDDCLHVPTSFGPRHSLRVRVRAPSAHVTTPSGIPRTAPNRQLAVRELPSVCGDLTWNRTVEISLDAGSKA